MSSNTEKQPICGSKCTKQTSKDSHEVDIWQEAQEATTFGYNLLFHRFQVTEDWQKYAWTSLTLTFGMLVILVTYAIDSQTDIFVNNLPTQYIDKNGALNLPQQLEQFPYYMLSLTFLHFDFWHYLSNIVLFNFLSTMYLERKYHWYRLIPIMIMGMIGSTLAYISVYLWRLWGTLGHFPIGQEDLSHGDQLVFAGFSGVVYTIVGLYVMETIVNWHSLHYRFIKVGLTIILTIEPIMQAIFREEFYENVAVSAHIGGLLVGLFPAIMYIPNDWGQKWQKVFNSVAIIGFVIIYGVLTTFVCVSVYG